MALLSLLLLSKESVAVSQEVCPDPEAGNTWEGSRTFLRVREASKRLQASIRSEHTLMRDAHAAFRQV